MKSVFHSSYFISRLFPPYNLIATTANGEFELWISCTPRGANQLNFKALGKHDTRLDTPFGFVLFNQNNEMDSLQIEILFLSVMCVCVCVYIYCILIFVNLRILKLLIFSFFTCRLGYQARLIHFKEILIILLELETHLKRRVSTSY